MMHKFSIFSEGLTDEMTVHALRVKTKAVRSDSNVIA